MAPRLPRLKAIEVLTACTALWALSFPVMKALALEQQRLLPVNGSWFFTSLGVFYRFGLAGLAMTILCRRELKTLSRREMEQGIWLAVFGVSGILFQMDALAYTAASTCAFLTQGYCVFIPLWVAVTQGRRPTLKIFLSVALVMAGVAVLARVHWGEFRLGRGELETLLASLLFTGQILCLEQPRYAANRPGVFSTVMFLGMALGCLPLVLATMPAPAACWQAYASVPAAGMLAILVVCCTLMAYTLMNRWQRQVTATEAGLIYCVEPVITSVFALFLPGLFSRWAGIDYPNETMTIRLVFGGGLILAANLLLQSRWLGGPEKPGWADEG